MRQRRAVLANGNALRLGLFGANCSSGRTYATLPERWHASWENNLRLAQLADEIGIECMVPIARWKGYGGESNPNGSSFESIAWACGLLAATRRLQVFCTVHVPLHHPLVAAKQMATGDHIGQGRLGVNIVCGWNEDEFQMFGVSKKEHDARYAQGEEWWSIVTKIWAGEARFDYDGTYYRLHGVEGAPRPFAWLFRRTRPPATAMPVVAPCPGIPLFEALPVTLMLIPEVSIPLTTMLFPNPRVNAPL